MTSFSVFNLQFEPPAFLKHQDGGRRRMAVSVLNDTTGTQAFLNAKKTTADNLSVP